VQFTVRIGLFVAQSPHVGREGDIGLQIEGLRGCRVVFGTPTSRLIGLYRPLLAN
jgi:hypothetical protein